MELPDYIIKAMDILKEHGARGYAVGGCVRDALLGLTPHDYDLAVNVPPEETAAAFAGYRVIGTGLQHGTVTVVIDRHNVEITSFRTDGPYADMRRPESVRFTPSLKEDLARRDFTVNAMAYAPEEGITDLFGGREDLAAGVIRCVGAPEKRFGEDALRILRALRFASKLGFAIEPATAAAVLALRENLRHVSAERIFEELKALLRGAGAARVLAEYRPVIEECIPALRALSEEKYAAAAALAGALREERLSFAALVSPLGAEAAEEACRALKTDNRFRETVRFLAENRARTFVKPGEARRFLGTWGKERCALLMRFRAAAGTPEETLARVCAENSGLPKTLAELDLDGADLAAIGLRGRRIGETLAFLLDAAAAGDLPNERAALLEAAAKYKTQNEGGNFDG